MLDRKLLQSRPGRAAAIGFIIFIIFGNLWLAMALTGGQAPVWIGVGFAIGIAVALGGGIGMAILALKQRLGPNG